MAILNTMSAEDYHQHPAISKSALDRVAKSPAHYKAWLSEKHTQTPAMRFGTMAHSFILEPETIASRYKQVAKLDKRTKEYKELAEEAETQGVELVASDEWEKLERMAEAVQAHPLAKCLLKKGQAEVSLFSDNENQPKKARVDWLDSGLIVDLKTTEEALPRSFQHSAHKYRYHVQAAYYADLLEELVQGKPEFFFIAIEKEAPYGCMVYKACEEMLELGRKTYRKDLSTLLECFKSGVFPCYPQELALLDLPTWAYSEVGV